MKYILISVLLVWGCLNNKVLSQQQINCSGVFPHLAMIADQAPRTEAGSLVSLGKQIMGRYLCRTFLRDRFRYGTF